MDSATNDSIKVQTEPQNNSLVLRDQSLRARTCAWPAVFFLAVVPTANIQMPPGFGSFNETCLTCSASWRRRDIFGDYEIYSDWAIPGWEDIRVPQLRMAGNIRAKYKYEGVLKWRQYHET